MVLLWLPGFFARRYVCDLFESARLSVRPPQADVVATRDLEGSGMANKTRTRVVAA